MSREEYYTIVKENNLVDALGAIKGISFTQKVGVLLSALRTHKPEVINAAFTKMKNKIDLDAVSVSDLRRQVISRCAEAEKIKEAQGEDRKSVV